MPIHTHSNNTKSRVVVVIICIVMFRYTIQRQSILSEFTELKESQIVTVCFRVVCGMCVCPVRDLITLRMFTRRMFECDKRKNHSSRTQTARETFVLWKYNIDGYYMICGDRVHTHNIETRFR